MPAKGHQNHAEYGIIRDPAIAPATAIAACPDGNADVLGFASRAVTVVSRSYGRERSNAGFSTRSLIAR